MPQELFDTTMDPNSRKLIQLTTENIEQTMQLYNILMGNSPAARRSFILNNKLSAAEEEEMFDEDLDDLV